MAISGKPPKKDLKAIEKIINKGGSVPKNNEKNKTKNEKNIKYVQLRLSTKHIQLIDTIRKKEIFPMSRHQWILRAIEKEINKDKL